MKTLIRPNSIAFAAVFLLILAAGCITAPPAGPKTFTFFPPSPDEPRVQFLTSFSSDLDLGKTSGFADFVTGRATGPKALVKPYGLALKDGKLYVCDTMSATIEVFDLVKKRVREFTPRAEGRLSTPINITIDADGTRYVADTGRGQVVIYSKDDVYLAAMGAKGDMKASDIALRPERIYVTDLQNHCVKVFTKADRKLMFTIPRDPKSVEGKLFSPTNLALDKNNHLLVSDTGAFVVQVYDLEGKFLRTIGQQGVAPGMFARPKGVAVDREGRAYVVDAATQVIQIFDAEGRLLLFFGPPGARSQGETYMPGGGKIDYDNVNLFRNLAAPGQDLDYLILVSSQFGYNKISVYGFLKKK